MHATAGSDINNLNVQTGNDSIDKWVPLRVHNWPYMQNRIGLKPDQTNRPEETQSITWPDKEDIDQGHAHQNLVSPGHRVRETSTVTDLAKHMCERPIIGGHNMIMAMAI